jgi:predicted glycoside hydrolase/deacetylase ChbG (UPF0249 family)
MEIDIRRLIVQADDLGETLEITHGILECIDKGVVTSTTILANMPGTEHALKEAAKRGSVASFGVHLNLCDGLPLTESLTLTQPDGTFHPKRSIALRAITGRLDLDEVKTELYAQVARIQAGGIHISHFDSHKHLHQLPGVSKVVARLARNFGIERIRCTLENGVWPRCLGVSASLSRVIRHYLAMLVRVRFSAIGLRHPDRVFNVQELIKKRDSRLRLAFLYRLNGLTEMFCHPGTLNADLEKPGSCARHQELEFLLSDEFRWLVKEAQIKLQTYWDC